MNYKIEKINNVYSIIDHGSYKCVYLDDDNTYMINDGSSEFSRLMTYYKNGFAILSSNRAENTDEENIKNSKQLEQDIRSLGFGYRKMLGGFIENKGMPNEVVVNEISYAVPYNKTALSEQDFYNKMVSLGKKYNQDAILICLPELTKGSPWYIDQSGNPTMKFESVRLSTPEDIYFTEPKKAPRFTFDSDELNKLNQKYFGKQMPVTVNLKYKENFDINTGCHLAKDTLPFEKEIVQYTKLIKDMITKVGDLDKEDIESLLYEPKNPYFNLKFYDSHNKFNKSKLIDYIVNNDKYLDFKDGKITLHNFPKEIYK